MGRLAAQDNGVESPATAARIHYGLAGIASMSGHERLSPDEVARRIRFALFADDRTDTLDLQQAEAIEGLILETTWSHVDSDEHQRLFDLWFHDNSFVKQVAQKVQGVPYSDARDQVNEVLLNLGFNSLWHVGSCVHALMRFVMHGLSSPLSPTELIAYEQMYAPQSYFAGLPLILLREKLEFVEGVLWRLFLHPHDERAISNFHCLLGFYGHLVRANREADRLRKARTAEQSRNTSEAFVPDVNELPRLSEAEQDRKWRELILDITEHLIGDGQLSCPCAKPSWRYANIEVFPESVTLIFECRNCSKTARPAMLPSELEKFGM
jgi:hypothetical protein